MATKGQYDYGRRANTEMPEREKLGPIDLNALPDKTADNNHNEDLDDIDF
jgi:hypothetical protein